METDKPCHGLNKNTGLLRARLAECQRCAGAGHAHTNLALAQPGDRCVVRSCTDSGLGARHDPALRVTPARRARRVLPRPRAASRIPCLIKGGQALAERGERGRGGGIEGEEEREMEGEGEREREPEASRITQPRSKAPAVPAAPCGRPARCPTRHIRYARGPVPHSHLSAQLVRAGRPDAGELTGFSPRIDRIFPSSTSKRHLRA